MNHFAFLKKRGGVDTITKLDDDVINPHYLAFTSQQNPAHLDANDYLH